MKKLLAVVTLSGAAFIGAPSSANALQAGGGAVTRVVCKGVACGGNGGGSSSPFLYQIRPNGNEIDSFEVGVDDGDPAHYDAFVHPTDWEWSIEPIARAHDEPPTAHGTVTGSAGTCPYVLRFSKGDNGATQTATFEVGYSYTLGEQFHDVHWKTSDGRQAGWTFPLGTNNGPVHSPVPLNVLVIVLDDVGTDKLTIYDEVYAELPGPPTAGTSTPRLNTLANDGIVFTNYYTNPLCATSRAALLSGRYGFRTGLGSIMKVITTPPSGCFDPVPDGIGQDYCYKLLDEEVLLPELLKEGFLSGLSYTSGAFGKYHLSYWTPELDLPPKPGLEPHAIENGFDLFYGHMANVDDEENEEFNHFNWKKVEHETAGSVSVFEIENHWEATEVREDAVEWINTRTQPFFAYVAFNPPHVPAQIPPEDLLTSETLSALEDCTSNCGLLIYKAMLEAVDKEIANLIDGIDPVKRANTMIFVVGDNGTPKQFIEPPHNIDHGKFTIYQIGVRVPLIVQGPLVPEAEEGSRSDHLVNVVDLWRTIGQIAGADEQRAFQNLGISPCGDPWIDSVSFLPLIKDPDPTGPPPRTWAFSQLFFPNLDASDLCTTIFDPPHMYYDCLTSNLRAITDGEFKLIRTRISGNCSTSATYDEEFYWIGPIGRPDADVGEATDLLDASGALISGAPLHAQDALDGLRDQMTEMSGD